MSDDRVAIGITGDVSLDPSQAESVLSDFERQAAATAARVKRIMEEPVSPRIDARAWEEIVRQSKGFTPGGRTATEQLAARTYTTEHVPAAAIAEARRAMTTPAAGRTTSTVTVGPSAEDLEAQLHQRSANWFRAVLGGQRSFLENRRKIEASLKTEMERLHELERAYERIQRVGTPDAVTLTRREAEMLEQHYFVQHLRDQFRAGVTAEQARPEPGPSVAQQALQGLQGLTVGQALKGGGLTALLGSAGRLAMAHPITAAVLATVGGAYIADRVTSEASRYSEQLDIEFANLARRTGRPLNLRALIEPHRRIRPEFQRLGFAGEDLAKVMSAYGVPATDTATLSATGAQARFARAFGFGDHLELIAGVGRRATQLGLAEPAQQGQFFGLLAAAVEQGMTQGVDASETMKAILTSNEEAAKHLGVVSMEYARGLAALQATFGAGESRYFKGEAGAQRLGGLTDALQHPKSIQAEALILNTLQSHFGGVPTARDLGLTDYRATAYERLPEMEKWQYVQEQLPRLLADNTAGPKARGALAGLAAGLGRGLRPEHEQLILMMLTGKGPAELVEMEQAMYEAAVKAGVPRARAKQMGGLELYATLGRQAIEEEKRLKAATIPEAPLTQAERLRFADTAIMETFSGSVSDASAALREFTKDAELAAARLGADLASGRALGAVPEAIEQLLPEETRENRLRSRTESLFQPDSWSGRGADRLIDLFEALGMGKRTAPRRQSQPPGTDEGNAITDWLLQQEEERQRGRPYRQSWSPSGESPVFRLDQGAPLRIEIAGAITLTGAAVEGSATRIPGAELTDLVAHLIRDRLRSEQTMRSTRTARQTFIT